MAGVSERVRETDTTRPGKGTEGERERDENLESLILTISRWTMRQPMRQKSRVESLTARATLAMYMHAE